MKDSVFKPRIAPITAACMALGLALPLPTISAATTLEEIVVTARKKEESLQDVPISIVAFTASDLKEMSVSTVKDITRFSPGLNMTSGPSGGNDAFFYIRGIGQFDHNAAADPGVGVYLDEVYMGRVAGSAFDLLDIERIEVLRGPQGTVFGRNTIGGAVSIVTGRPSGEFGGQVKAIVGERDRGEIASMIDFAIADNLFAKVSGQWREQDGWGERVYDGETFQAVENSSFRVKLLWEASENLDFLLAADTTDTDGTSSQTWLADFNPAAFASPLGVPFPFDLGAEKTNDVYDNFTSIDPIYETESDGISLTVNWRIGNMNIKSITSSRELEQFVTNDFDAGRYSFYDSFFKTDQEQFSQEFQFTGIALNDKLDWLLGLYYFDEEVFYNNAISMGTNNGQPFFIFPGGVPTPNPAYGATRLDGRAIWNNQQFDLDVESRAVYAQFTYAISDKLSVTLGGRYTEEEKEQAFNFFIDNTDNIFNLAGLPPIVIPTLSPSNPFNTVPTTYEEDWEKFTSRVSLDYQVSSEILVYLSFAEGFKSGGWNGRPTPGPTGAFGIVPSYDPEEVETFEIGLKSQLLDNRVRLNATAYFSEYSEIQMLVVGASGFFENINAGKADINGIELDITALPTDNLEIFAGLSYVDAEYSSLLPGAAASGITKDDDLPNTPELTLSLGVQYTWSLDDLGSLRARADYMYQDDVYFNAANNTNDLQDSYGLWNTRLTYISTNERLTVAAFLLNAGDKEYFSSGQDVLGPLGVAFVQVAPPREWGLEVSYSF